ncbi:hypothetical protein [Shinella sp.]|uniref:hypothetical protein n=1 Tax=unclassified Shinella TaxID=2643062 RepID=UPI00225D6568|nr:conserved hypothetical protein [Rhizobiaceae bacterium]CAK7262005.1 conserved protein of unknown function [Shinella sp. WSC3-e]
MSIPVHSAHVGDEVEVFYRWHPYFGQKVCIRRVDRRAIGQFLQVLGPAGVVVSIAGWMIDPVACAGMTMGSARVDLAALIELNRLVMGGDKPAIFQGGRGVAQEEDDETSQYAGAGLGSAAQPDIRNTQARRTERQRSGESDINAGTAADAGSLTTSTNLRRAWAMQNASLKGLELLLLRCLASVL